MSHSTEVRISFPDLTALEITLCSRQFAEKYGCLVEQSLNFYGRSAYELVDEWIANNAFANTFLSALHFMLLANAHDIAQRDGGFEDPENFEGFRVIISHHH